MVNHELTRLTIRMTSTFIKYFVYVGYPLFVINLLKKTEIPGPVWEIWLVLILSVAGCFALVRMCEEFLIKRRLLGVQYNSERSDSIEKVTRRSRSRFRL